MLQKSYFQAKNIKSSDQGKYIVIIGFGSFRNEFSEGPISENDMSNVFPFEGNVV